MQKEWQVESSEHSALLASVCRYAGHAALVAVGRGSCLLMVGCTIFPLGGFREAEIGAAFSIFPE
jgi:hypothetical protein